MTDPMDIAFINAIKIDPFDRSHRNAYLDYLSENHARQRDAILVVANKYPLLNGAGFGYEVARGMPPEERQHWLERWRRYLTEDTPDRIMEFNLSLVWLAGCQAIKTINTRTCSYGYKHHVERYWDRRGFSPYVSSGMFIAAALHAGFKWGFDSGDEHRVHPYFNISRKLKWDKSLNWNVRQFPAL